MELTLRPNALHDEAQNLIIDKVAVLIGKNGSGKSLILKSIFEQKIKDKAYNNLNVVCISSGQNENYSLLHGKYLTSQRRKKNSINLDCFYFDKSWSKLLIFLATALKINGKVRTFLRKHGYVDESTDMRDDISTTLYCKFTVKKDYIALVNEALKQEEKFYTDSLRTQPFFRTLDSFITNIIDDAYTFNEPLTRKIIITASDLFEISFDFTQQRQNEDEETKKNIVIPHLTPEMSFFTQASDRNYFIDKSKATLKFKNDLELSQLSDGEYQILFLYAILDLFDNENTLFLLDEADSHLHHENIGLLWNNLHSIRGNAITTTHLLDSITANENTINHLKLIEKGKVDEANKNRKLIERLKVLSQAQSAEFAIYANLPYLVLIDDQDDWDIFTLLAKRKNLDVSKFKNIVIRKETSNYSSASMCFAKKKLRWVEKFRLFTMQRQTQHIFLICDRDEAALEFKNNNVEVCGLKAEIAFACGSNNPLPMSLLAWKRREIKHYLLSHTALNSHNKTDDINIFLSSMYCLKPNDSSDNDDICRLKSDIVKNVIDDFIYIDQNSSGEKTFSIDALQAYINLIPPEEISIDIENMYNFIVEKIK